MLELLAILFICGRFYYLMGYVGHLKPTAPVAFIFLKDILLILIILSFFFLRKTIGAQKYQSVFLLWLVFFIGVAIIHLNAKSISEWGQHYLRNVILVILSIPALYRWTNSKINFNFNKVIIISSFLNIIAAISQELLLPDTLLGKSRPLGFVGDPISLTALILIFQVAIWLEELPILPTVILSIISGYTLNMAASISAALASAAALIPIFVMLFKKLQLEQRKSLLHRFWISLLSIFIGLAIPHHQQYDNLTERISALRNNYEKQEHKGTEQELLYENLKRGRSQSLQITKESISSEKTERDQLALWIGGYKEPAYRRVDSTPAVLILNWGLINCLIFYFTFIFLITHFGKKIIFSKSNSLRLLPFKQSSLAIFCLLQILLLGFLNSVLYRSPLNFIIALATTQIVHILSDTK